MFYILRHKGNANQNIEILPHPSHSGYHQEKKQRMLMRIQEKKKKPSYTACGNVN
jgi:hypothetical protein